ncbi:MAG: hypothetical protein IJ689_00045 [Alphaproteobacteria bacterium]|nr:hypothetical protein [Alphaproteobacteria bacterium]
MDNEPVNNSGTDLLNATQEAVIGAVNDVGNIIRNTGEEIYGNSHEPFYLSPEFWVGVTFVLVMVALFVPLKKALSAMLDKRIKAVENSLSEAEKLRDEARTVLAEYEQKTEEAPQIAQKMIDKANADIKQYCDIELKKFAASLTSQEIIADNALKNRQEQVIAAASELVADRAGEILRAAIADNLSQETQSELIDRSINALQDLKKA